MTAVTRVSSSAPPSPGPAQPAAGVGAPILLSPAESASLTPAQSALTQLYLAMAANGVAQTEQGKDAVDASNLHRTSALEKEHEALIDAREERDKGGVFDFISDNVGLFGVVGLVTFNYALVAASVAAHKSGALQNVKVDVVDVGAVATGRVDVLAGDLLLRKADFSPQAARDVVEKCGIPRDAPGISDEDVKPVAKKVLMANLFIAGVTASALTGGSTAAVVVALAGVAISSAGNYVAEHAVLDGIFGEGSSKAIGLGMEIYGTAASAMSSLASGAALLPTKAVSGFSSAVNGGTSLLRGTDQVVTAAHEYAAAKADVRAEDAKAQLDRLSRFVDMVLDGIREASDSTKKASESVQKICDSVNQTNVAIAQGMKV